MGLNLEANSNIKLNLSTAALPGKTTEKALTEEFMVRNAAYRPIVYIPKWDICRKNTCVFVAGINTLDQSICTLLSNLSGQPDIFLGSGS